MKYLIEGNPQQIGDLLSICSRGFVMAVAALDKKHGIAAAPLEAVRFMPAAVAAAHGWWRHPDGQWWHILDKRPPKVWASSLRAAHLLWCVRSGHRIAVHRRRA